MVNIVVASAIIVIIIIVIVILIIIIIVITIITSVMHGGCPHPKALCLTLALTPTFIIYAHIVMVASNGPKTNPGPAIECATGGDLGHLGR